MFPFPDSPARTQFLIGVIALVVALFWPLTPALSSSDQRVSRLVCVVIIVAATGAVSLLGRSLRPLTWATVAAVSGAAAVMALTQHFNASSQCLADYNGEPTIIGRALTPEGEQVVRRNPRQSQSELLLWVGGQVSVVWTEQSVAGCRFWVSWGGLLTVPLFAICVGSLAARRGATLWAGGTAKAAVPLGAASTPLLYDAFISYRRLDRDRAETLAEALESRGLKVAIDFRDFRPNETVLAEMERCIIESRFVLCVITQNYGSSGFTNEEALMAKLLDLTDRRNRIVPLIFEHAPMPAWLQGLVGVNFTQTAQIDPIEKLMALLKPVDAR
jgi:hypothetical protein